MPPLLVIALLGFNSNNNNRRYSGTFWGVKASVGVNMRNVNISIRGPGLSKNGSALLLDEGEIVFENTFQTFLQRHGIRLIDIAEAADEKTIRLRTKIGWLGVHDIVLRQTTLL